MVGVAVVEVVADVAEMTEALALVVVGLEVRGDRFRWVMFVVVWEVMNCCG